VCLHTEMEQFQKEVFEYRTYLIKSIRAKGQECKRDKNPKVYQDYVKKYPFLEKKITFPSLKEMFNWQEFTQRFTDTEKNKLLLKLYIAKITGLFKHGQSEKTGLCNERIVSNVKFGYLSICIAKNSLDASEQWTQRLIYMLRKQFPTQHLKDMILTISSRPNTLNGNATHCQNFKQAQAELFCGNFRIIFVCSNKYRFEDLVKLLDCYCELPVHKQLPIDIQHDEAHNINEGIPTKRAYIEHLIMNPFVRSYVPISASPGPIYAEDEPLWKRANIDAHAINYSQRSSTVSTSPDYSSLRKAFAIAFDQYLSHPSYQNYNITEFDEETFDEANEGYYAKWTDAEKIQADKIRRRQLEFFPSQGMAMEIFATNIGRNILDNFLTYKYKEGDTQLDSPIFLKDVFNLHIMTTPLRVALTIHLMKYAVQKDYSPICIGLYRSGIYIRYKNRAGQFVLERFGGDFVPETQSSEMNSKIHAIFNHLKNRGESVKRPFIIFGNYQPTGESITFVNFTYGTIRSDTLLPVGNQTREMSYQGFLRCCYMDTKFKENNPNFVQPVKFIIGSQESINDALAYELENDERVKGFTEGSHTPLLANPIVELPKNEEQHTNISTPVKITLLDNECQDSKTLQSIFSDGPRSLEDRKQILHILHRMHQSGNLDAVDPTGKFDFNLFTLDVVRSYKKQTEEKELERRNKKASEGKKYTPYEADYRFQEYESSHKHNNPYINNKNKIQPNHCELLVALDKYELDRFVNHKSVLWLSYRYA
jgi:hypothetical protein